MSFTTWVSGRGIQIEENWARGIVGMDNELYDVGFRDGGNPSPIGGLDLLGPSSSRLDPKWTTLPEPDLSMGFEHLSHMRAIASHVRKWNWTPWVGTQCNSNEAFGPFSPIINVFMNNMLIWNCNVGKTSFVLCGKQ